MRADFAIQTSTFSNWGSIKTFYAPLLILLMQYICVCVLC